MCSTQKSKQSDRSKKSYWNTMKVKEKYKSKWREIQQMVKVMLDRWVEWEWQGKTQVATINRTNSLWQMFPLAVVIIMMMMGYFCLKMIYLKKNIKTHHRWKVFLWQGGRCYLAKQVIYACCVHTGKTYTLFSHTYTICVCSQVISACILCITRQTVCM